MIEVIIPWRETPDRVRACRWVLGRYRQLGWKATLAVAPSGPWCKGCAVAGAVARTPADVVVIADADVWCPALPEAINAVETGAPVAIPHGRVHRLTALASEALYAGADGLSLPTDERPYAGVFGGGLVALQRSVAKAVPIDPRFLGWGQEDEAWGMALIALYGAPWEGSAPLFHLYHEPQQRLDRKRGSAEGWELRRRYMKARYNTDDMRALVKEAHEHFRTTDPPLHDHAQDRGQ